MEPLLKVADLRVRFDMYEGVVRAVDGIHFELQEGRTLGMVGESGCGKSVTARAIMRLIPSPPGRIASGKIFFRNQDLLLLGEKAIRKVRGNTISMIFQEPMTSLNPVYTIGDQIAEVIRLHQKAGRSEAREQSISLLRQVGIPDPARRFFEYPHQMSGGMRQRAMIAMALACRPSLLIADEPTTALDVTTQAQILTLMRALQQELGTSILLIAHDLAVIAEMADQVAVMYAGKIVEYGDVRSLFRAPAHPYTGGLLASIPRLDAVKERLHVIHGIVPNLMDLPPGCRFEPRCARRLEICRSREPEATQISSDRWVLCFNPLEGAAGKIFAGHGEVAVGAEAGKTDQARGDRTLVKVVGLTKHFPVRRGILLRETVQVKALNGVSFEIKRGDTLGIVGESGCGKTTLGRVMLRLIEATSGEVFFEDQDIFSLSEPSLRKLRRRMQIVFQDPYGSLNPRMSVERIVSHGLRVHRMGTFREQKERALELLHTVGLKADQASRYPHEFSGGQRQRIAIARALAMNPSFIIADEPVSALDVSIQSQILNLMNDLKVQFDLTYLFVTHNLSVAKHISDRVAVLYLGKLVEMARKEDLFKMPVHPYTVALLSAIPVPNPEIQSKRMILGGEVPSAINLPEGCYFSLRCSRVSGLCKEEGPSLREVAADHWVACHYI